MTQRRDTGLRESGLPQGKSAKEMMAAGRNGHWGPVVDGVNLLQTPVELIQAGEYNKKAPVIIGSNRDEVRR